MADLNFEALLAQHNQDYRDAKEFDSWMPDDGEYTIVITNCDKGVSTKDDKSSLWWKHTGRILAGDDPSVIDREFTSGFFSSNNYGMAKGQARVLNNGVTPEGSAEFDAVLSAAGGVILKVKVTTTTSRKNGKEYTNCYYQEVIAAEAPEEQPAEPPQSEPAPAEAAPATPI